MHTVFGINFNPILKIHWFEIFGRDEIIIRGNEQFIELTISQDSKSLYLMGLTSQEANADEQILDQNQSIHNDKIQWYLYILEKKFLT